MNRKVKRMKFEIKRNKTVLYVLGSAFMVSCTLMLLAAVFNCSNGDVEAMCLIGAIPFCVVGLAIYLYGNMLSSFYFLIEPNFLTIQNGERIQHILDWESIDTITYIDNKLPCKRCSLTKARTQCEIAIKLTSGEEYRYIGSEQVNHEMLEMISHHHDVINFP